MIQIRNAPSKKMSSTTDKMPAVRATRMTPSGPGVAMKMRSVPRELTKTRARDEACADRRLAWSGGMISGSERGSSAGGFGR